MTRPTCCGPVTLITDRDGVALWECAACDQVILVLPCGHEDRGLRWPRKCPECGASVPYRRWTVKLRGGEIEIETGRRAE